MSIFSIILLAVGLAMDAFAVSICIGLSNNEHNTFINSAKAGVWFGLFQGLMPAIGYTITSLISDKIMSYSHFVSAGLLFLVGINMIREGLFQGKSETNTTIISTTAFKMFVLAIATSIDALSAGITFAVLPANINSNFSIHINTLFACIIIAVTTLIISISGVFIGAKIGDKLRDKSVILGGIVLILLGIKVLFF